LIAWLVAILFTGNARSAGCRIISRERVKNLSCQNPSRSFETMSESDMSSVEQNSEDENLAAPSSGRNLDTILRIPASKSGPSVRTLKGPDKAAALLLCMGKPLAARLLKQFDNDELRQITRSVAELGTVGSHARGGCGGICEPVRERR
jgi:hypothetical protein